MIGRILVGVGAAVAVGVGAVVVLRRRKPVVVKPLTPRERLEVAKTEQAALGAAYQVAKAKEELLYRNYLREAVDSPEWHAAYAEYRAAYKATTEAFDAYYSALKATNAAIDAVYGEPTPAPSAAA